RAGSLRLRHAGEITSLAFSPDGNLLASCGGDSRLTVWDTSGRLRHTFPLHDDIVGFWHHFNTARFTPDGERLVATDHKAISVFDLTADRLLARHELPKADCVAVSPDGNTVAVGREKRIILLDATSGQELRAFGCPVVAERL